jgi:hypothetical protein
MSNFVHLRGHSLGLVVLVMIAVSLAQGSISYTFVFGDLRGWHALQLASLAMPGYLVRWGLVAWMAVLWLLMKKRLLFTAVIVANVFSTLLLFLHAGLLIAVLAGVTGRAVGEPLRNVVLMGTSNVLVFSVWYWIVDPPGIEHEEPAPEEWAFLFPQRGSSLPNFSDWEPHYTDYLFLAFTTSFAFSPADTLPLTRAAKLLMLLQAVISVVTLTGIAGSAVNILAEGASRG